MTSPIEAIGAVHGIAQAGLRPDAQPVVTEVMTERFASLMNPAGAPARPGPATAVDEGPSAIGQVMATQEDFLRKAVADGKELSVNADHYSKDELLQVAMKVNHQMNFAVLSLNVTTAVAQASNKGLQALLKNQ